MKRIVKGNDFTLRIPVAKVVEGEKVAFPLPACTDVVVRIANQYKRVSLDFSIDTAEDNVILAKVEGDQISLGTYAVEVRGKIFGNDWRSNEYPQFQIVGNNADADTEFGTTDEGMTAWKWTPPWWYCRPRRNSRSSSATPTKH